MGKGKGKVSVVPKGPPAAKRDTVTGATILFNDEERIAVHAHCEMLWASANGGTGPISAFMAEMSVAMGIEAESLPKRSRRKRR